MAWYSYSCSCFVFDLAPVSVLLSILHHVHFVRLAPCIIAVPKRFIFQAKYGYGAIGIIVRWNTEYFCFVLHPAPGAGLFQRSRTATKRTSYLIGLEITAVGEICRGHVLAVPEQLLHLPAPAQPPLFRS